MGDGEKHLKSNQRASLINAGGGGGGGAPKKKATGFLLLVDNFSAVYFRESCNSGSKQPMIYIPAGVKDIVLSLPSVLCVFV